MSFSRLRKDLSKEDQSFLHVYNVVNDLERKRIEEEGASGSSNQVSFRTEMLANAFMTHGGSALVDAMGETVSNYLYTYCEEFGYVPVLNKTDHFLNCLKSTIKYAFISAGFNPLDLTLQQFNQMTEYWTKVSQEQVRGIMSEETRRENRRKKKINKAKMTTSNSLERRLSDTRRVALVGDGHVVRLPEEELPYEVFKDGQYGATIQNINDNIIIDDIVNMHPDIVVICAGGNDIVDPCNVSQIKSNILTLRERFTDMGIPCLISEIFCRSKPQNISPRKFQTIRSAVHRGIRSRTPPCTLIHYPGMNDGWLGADGIYLNEMGTSYFINGLQFAIDNFFSQN